MKYLILTVLLIQSALLHAQFKTEYFLIEPSLKPIQGVYYNEIELVDLRHNTADLGLISRGRNPILILPKLPLQQQLTNVVLSLSDSTAGKKKLVMMLRDFHFVKPNDRRFATYVALNADVFSYGPEGYQWITTTNRMFEFTSSISMNNLLKAGADVITKLVNFSLIRHSESERTFTYAEALNIDSIQKKQIMVYNTKRFTDGIYMNWEQFSKQQPGLTKFTTTMELNRLKQVNVTDETGNEVALDTETFIAVVKDGIPYAASPYGLYPLKKVGNDFYFSAVSKKFNGAAYLNYGVIGGLAGGPDIRFIKFVLMPVEGKFYRTSDGVNTN